ncbi:twin-arginine translocase subunit TatC [Sunxiuqinia elliptica]|uniref:Sec-independent protein translocase protein TatC n=1 Tax=Sunxiuqinia elliptica TaxID=655355 RepID=A0A4R6HB30_9BACT|nr:twin-arginine translocase subunit TatC [Sunxiuqinia elliptica]TDO04936.1 Sec-independent protein translocase TatC [Sunxiuqinia elliptica]TDO64484.1 Sec-independent protein translocase TatC [Sunxiuqinia elliptica]
MTEAEYSEQQSTKKKTTKKQKQEEMSFLEHLEELRWHIIRAFLAIVIFAILAFINKDFIFDTVIFNPKTPDFWTNQMFAKLAELTGVEGLRINGTELQLISIKMADNFMTHIMTSIVAGLIVSSPYVFFEVWRFISPALYENERRHSGGAVVYMSLLFITGVLFGYFLIVPLSIHFLGSYSISSEVVNQINMRSYIGTVTSISLASGVIFELPIFVYFLSKIGILTPDLMKKYRRHAYVALLLLSAIITPPDVFSQIMVCFPLVFLYEVGIIISKRVNKKAEEDLEAL